MHRLLAGLVLFPRLAVAQAPVAVEAGFRVAPVGGPAAAAVNIPLQPAGRLQTLPSLTSPLVLPKAKLPVFQGPSVAAAPEVVRAEYSEFLAKVGFRDYPAEIRESLKAEGLTETQEKVLEFNEKRYRVLNSARGLAAEVMAGLSEQDFSPEAVERGAELSARLLSLQPLDAPSSLPAEIAKKDRDGIVDWMTAVTVEKVVTHLSQVVSDVVKTAVSPETLKKNEAAHDKDFSDRVIRIKDLSENLLVTAYTDAEVGQTRYAGRALAASLVRFSRTQGRPEIEAALAAKLKDRGLHLENFVGDTLVLDDAASGKTKRLKIETGDFLGERSGGREASEITFAVRPPFKLWLKARGQNLLGGFLGLWANPKAAPKFVKGQTLRNRAKFAVWTFKKWLAGRPALRKGYSHVGMASVEEADGVAMLWALDNYPNAGEGGIRKMGVAEQFAMNGPYLRLGVARLDARKTWDAFAAQANTGFQKEVYPSEGGNWPSAISPEERAALAAIPKSRAPELARQLNARAAAVLERMLVRYGVGFAYGFSNELWRAYCSATMMLAHRMGSQFEVQAENDRWHPLILLMKKFGIGDAKEQKTDGRIIWPGSLFIDPKIGRHESVSFPGFTEVGRLADPYTAPAYVEMDPALTETLRAGLHLSGGSLRPDEDVIAQMIRTHLDSRAQKSRGKNGYRSGANPSSGYSAGLEALLSESDDD